MGTRETLRDVDERRGDYPGDPWSLTRLLLDPKPPEPDPDPGIERARAMVRQQRGKLGGIDEVLAVCHKLTDAAKSLDHQWLLACDRLDEQRSRKPNASGGQRRPNRKNSGSQSPCRTESPKHSRARTRYPAIPWFAWSRAASGPCWRHSMKCWPMA